MQFRQGFLFVEKGDDDGDVDVSLLPVLLVLVLLPLLGATEILTTLLLRLSAGRCWSVSRSGLDFPGSLRGIRCHGRQCSMIVGTFAKKSKLI